MLPPLLPGAWWRAATGPTLLSDMLRLSPKDRTPAATPAPWLHGAQCRRQASPAAWLLLCLDFPEAKEAGRDALRALGAPSHPHVLRTPDRPPDSEHKHEPCCALLSPYNHIQRNPVNRGALELSRTLSIFRIAQAKTQDCARPYGR